MKKLLLSVGVVAASYALNAQVVVSGVSPAAVQGNYDFGVQTHEGWPGEAGDGSWNLSYDFNIPGTFIQDTLMFVDDGTPGTNTQGNPMSAEGCDPLINDLTGKIAVIYRNTCEFGTKALNAQNAGAEAILLINREDALLGMLGGTDGINVTIPMVVVSSVDGQTITDAMANGPVVMFIGNKLGAFGDDIGAVKGEYLVSPFAGANSTTYDGFQPGIQLYNYGANDQTDVLINASIDGPNGNYYNETVGPFAMNSGDTIGIFPGDPNALPAWAEGVGNYDAGNYTLTYTLTIDGVTDENAFDNVYTSDFKIQDEVISLSRLDGNNMPISNSYPSNATTDYNSCMYFVDSSASAYAVDGMWFVPHADTSVFDMSGSEMFGAIYEWNDAWVDLDDPNYWGTTATANPWGNIDLISFGYHYPNSNDEVDEPAYLKFQTQVQLVDNQRYLFCMNTTEVDNISFGYDGNVNYDANQSILSTPISPVKVDTTWYVGGWNGSSAASIALNTFDPMYLSIEETVSNLEVVAYPNPASDIVYFGTKESGEGAVMVTDLSGKLVAKHEINFDGSISSIDIASLEAGVYMFNITMNDGRSTTFNVVKH